MPKELSDTQKKFLLNEGDTVYISADIPSARSRTTQAELHNINNDKTIEFLMENHGKIIVYEDFISAKIPLPVEYVRFLVDEGVRGMVLSHFWEEHAHKKDENSEEEVAEPVIFTKCLLLIEDKIFVAPFHTCTKLLS